LILRKANLSELPKIWEILQQAIEQRRQDGSTQWQNGYPNEQTVHDDFEKRNSYVLIDNNEILACASIIVGADPNYKEIKGEWLTVDNYATIHRLATSDRVKQKGVATRLFEMAEDVCRKKKVLSIRADTNFDNVPMMRILEKLGYTYCGEILVSTAPRKAYEKLLVSL
jgi:ribosomal protein S18 acetylase RimI-like enzyme